MPDAIETALGYNLGLKDNDIFSNDLLFVNQLYRDLMGREGEADGVTYWMNPLAAGVSRGEIVHSFFTSPEFDSNAGAIVRLYHGVLDRSPDKCGFDYWLAQANAGMSAEEIGSLFLDSAELGEDWGSLSDGAFVDMLYQNILDRQAETEGRDYWLDQLNKGADRGGVLNSFVQSSEFKAATAGEVAVDMLYLGLLDRDADTAGWQYWMIHDDQGSFPDMASFYNLTSNSTSEYHNRFLPSEEPVIIAGVVTEPDLTL